MKYLFLFLAFLGVGLQGFAQQDTLAKGVKKYQLPVIYLPENVSVQFISPEPIQYVDISSKSVIGDLPLKNVLRIRLKDSIGLADAVVSVVGEKFIAQYHVVRADWITSRDAVTEVPITGSAMRPLDVAGIGLSQPQLKQISLNLFCKRPGGSISHAKAFGLKAELYHLYTAGDYIFLDVGYHNKTNLKYDIDAFHFTIDDEKVTKASNSQSVELKPVFTLFDQSVFQRTYRNILVFKKLTFPGNKLLHIELEEKQYSGRVIILAVSYQDVLDADVVPL